MTVKTYFSRRASFQNLMLVSWPLFNKIRLKTPANKTIFKIHHSSRQNSKIKITKKWPWAKWRLFCCKITVVGAPNFLFQVYRRRTAMIGTMCSLTRLCEYPMPIKWVVVRWISRMSTQKFSVNKSTTQTWASSLEIVRPWLVLFLLTNLCCSMMIIVESTKVHLRSKSMRSRSPQANLLKTIVTWASFSNSSLEIYSQWMCY